MMTSDDKVGGWVKKGQNHDDVILEWSLIQLNRTFVCSIIYVEIRSGSQRAFNPHKISLRGSTGVFFILQTL